MKKMENGSNLVVSMCFSFVIQHLLHKRTLIIPSTHLTIGPSHFWVRVISTYQELKQPEQLLQIPLSKMIFFDLWIRLRPASTSSGGTTESLVVFATKKKRFSVDVLGTWFENMPNGPND